MKAQQVINEIQLRIEDAEALLVESEKMLAEPQFRENTLRRRVIIEANLSIGLQIHRDKKTLEFLRSIEPAVG